MSDIKELETMREIMEQKGNDMAAAGLPELDAEGKALAERKRISFDQPTNAVTVDPLR